MALILGGDQSVTLNAVSIAGIQSASVSHGGNQTPVSCLGVGFLRGEYVDPLAGSLSLERVVVGSEIIFETGNIAGNYSYGNGGFSWETSNITSFSMSASANSLCTESIELEIRGTAGDTNSFAAPDDGEIAISNYITSNFPYGNIESIKYSISLNRETSYSIGSSGSFSDLIEPSEVETSIEFYVSGQVNTVSELCAPEEIDIAIVLKTCEGATIKTYNAPNSILQNIALVGSIDGKMKATVSYKSLLSNSELDALIV